MDGTELLTPTDGSLIGWREKKGDSVDAGLNEVSSVLRQFS